MFDRYVVAQTKKSWKRRFLMFASLFLHGAAAAVIVIWSFFHVEEIVPPALSLTVFSAPPPPPPPPPPAAHHRSVEHKVTPVVEHKMVQPTEVPKIVQPTQKEDKKEEDKPDEKGGVEGGEEGGEEGGTVGGTKGGVKGGVVGGTVGGTGTDLSAKGPPPKIVPQFVLAAQRVSAPDPHLPEFFRQQHAQQTVRGIYRITVRTDGRIGDVVVMTGIPGMDQTIIDQIKATWVFKPQPMPVYANWAFVFKIN